MFKEIGLLSLIIFFSFSNLVPCSNDAIAGNSKNNLPDSTRKKVQQLISKNKFNTKKYKRKFKTQNGKCQVNVSETLRVTTATVSKDVTYLHISYYCYRPDHIYKCGSGSWTSKTDASYYGKVTANINTIDNILHIEKLQNHDDNEERSCGNLVAQYLSSIDGLAL